MYKIILIAAIFFTSQSNADEWHNAIQGICNLESNNFKVLYHGKYNEGGEDMVKEVNSITETQCTINNIKYELKTRFFYDSANGRNRCSSHEYVEVQISKNGQSIFRELIQSDCHNSKDYISSILVETSPENIVVNRKQGTPY